MIGEHRPLAVDVLVIPPAGSGYGEELPAAVRIRRNCPGLERVRLLRVLQLQLALLEGSSSEAAKAGKELLAIIIDSKGLGSSGRWTACRYPLLSCS
jgi:hypothetical protein